MMKPEEATAIEDAQGTWEEGPLAKVLGRFPERRQTFETSSAEAQRFYTPLDVDGVDYLEDIGFPGQYPFTRGVQPTMYRGRLWTMRQYAGFGTPEETNERFRELLANGQTGLSVGLRPADPDRLRLGPPDGRRRGRPGRRRDRLAWRTWRRCSRASRWTASRPR